MDKQWNLMNQCQSLMYHIPIPTLPISHPMVTRSKTQKLKPKSFLDHQLYTVHSSSPVQEIEPSCVSQALKSSNWRTVVAAGLSALAQNATWDLVEPPTNAHIIGSKWVFKLKYRADGTVERHKANLVAKGYAQQEGINYYETFSPVVKPTTIRVVLSIALSQQWSIHQIDVNNAFLHGDLAVYMEQPPGYQDHLYPTHVCKLRKALYGLKQAPQAWFSKLKTFLISQQFTSSQANHSLFILQKSQLTSYLLMYVDYIISQEVV